VVLSTESDCPRQRGEKASAWISLDCADLKVRSMQSIKFLRVRRAYKDVQTREAVICVMAPEGRDEGLHGLHVIGRRRTFKQARPRLCSSNIHHISNFTSRHPFWTIDLSLHLISCHSLIFYPHNVCSPVDTLQAGTPQSSSSISPHARLY
jgi:hypothetical protein